MIGNRRLSQRLKSNLAFFIFIKICLLFAPVNAQQQSSKSQSSDTIVKIRVDTASDMKGRRKYVRQQSIIDSFSPFFVKDMVRPGDLNHAGYKRYLVKGNNQLEKAKMGLLQKINKYPEYLAKLNLKNVDELKDCKLVVLPVYYLTYNIASYNNESNFSSFFNLDTTVVTYRLIRNNKLLGIIKYENGEIYLRKSFSTSDSLTYNKIIAMHKEPLGFISGILLDDMWRSNTPYINLGFMSNGHIIFVSCSEHNYTQFNVGSAVGKPVYIKQCKINNDEAYYLGSDSTSGTLLQIIKGEDRVLKFKHNLKN